MTKARDVASRGGTNVVIPTSIVRGASGSASVSANGEVTFTGTESISLNGVFTSAYKNYRIIWNTTADSGGSPTTQFLIRSSNSDLTAGNYYMGGFKNNPFSGTVNVFSHSGQGYSQLISVTPSVGTVATIDFSYGGSSGASMWNTAFNGRASAEIGFTGSGYHASAAHDGFTIKLSTSTMTGTVRIYGYNNG